MPRAHFCRGCGSLVNAVHPDSRRCPHCHQRWTRARNATPEHQARRQISKSQRLRVYTRAHWRCERCGERDRTKLTLEHRDPLAHRKARGDNLTRPLHDDELETLCRTCNSRAGGQLAGARRPLNPRPPVS